MAPKNKKNKQNISCQDGATMVSLGQSLGTRGKVVAAASVHDEERKLRNAARFADHLEGGAIFKASSNKFKKRSRFAMAGGEGNDAAGSGTIKGTSTALEKSYFRLTSAPNPENVRPPHVLNRSLQHVKIKWAEEEQYDFSCDQLKAIRQDLTVQGVEDGLTVEVYQTHARIALESGDMDEYNQCQSRLKELHLTGVAGVRMDEFTGYRLVHSLYRENHREVNATMMDLTPSEKQGEGVAHALDVVKSYHMGDYCHFFRLYETAPNMTSYVMDFLVMRVRKHAFRVMVKAFFPTVPLTYVQHQLRFHEYKLVLEFVESDARACLTKPALGEEEAIDVKATRAAWTRQGLWS